MKHKKIMSGVIGFVVAVFGFAGAWITNDKPDARRVVYWTSKDLCNE